MIKNKNIILMAFLLLVPLGVSVRANEDAHYEKFYEAFDPRNLSEQSLKEKMEACQKNKLAHGCPQTLVYAARLSGKKTDLEYSQDGKRFLWAIEDSLEDSLYSNFLRFMKSIKFEDGVILASSSVSFYFFYKALL